MAGADSIADIALLHLVAIPVDGPARITSIITTGISATAAMEMDSAMRESPGPDVAVNARTPP